MLHSSRIRILLRLFIFYLALSAGLRALLFFLTGTEAFDGWLSLPGIFLKGAVNDLPPFFLITFIPALILLLPARAGRFNRWLISAAIFLTFSALIFTAVAEVVFWQEFHARFNFIAVDYLIYTTEVIRNIMESYPVIPLVATVILSGILCSFLLLWPFRKALSEENHARPLLLCWLAVIMICPFYTPVSASSNQLDREIAANGVWSLFSAYRNNQLSYREFYPTMDEQEAFRLLRDELVEPGAEFISGDPREWRRNIAADRPERRLNVIQIVVESLGSSLLGENTPNLNELAEKSLFFSNMMATGTRTVRGIEALTLSIPPTPGSSIVRRPGNEDLFTIGTPLRREGYDTTFLYGGYGYFDNMNAYFYGNGFRVTDRVEMAETFGNVWGVCDEDLFNHALKEADSSALSGKPFYQFVLTTSNHQPFTYPDGKVSIPSGSGRRGAVQYTDYAIGRFLKEAASRPWFKDTVFVIVADHTNGAAGRTSLPLERYHIPCFIYSPGNINPQKVDTLTSQIDVAPTVLSLLGISYESSFFGRNALAMKAEDGRAWVSTYQLLGYLKGQDLAILEPMKAGRCENSRGMAENNQSELLNLTVAAYQSAQDCFTQGRLRKK